jgi:hypothetical protein
MLGLPVGIQVLWMFGTGLYRFRTLHRACDLRFGRAGGLRQDRGSCLFVSCT